VIVGEAVFEAVFPPAFVAVHARHEGSVDQGLARGLRALLFVREDARFRGEGQARGWALVRLRASPRPLAGFGTCVCRLSAVVAAVGSPARFASEGEEVELSAVFGLAVRPDRFDVAGRHQAGIVVRRGG
jgi:hypothetical protein